jgi:tRNA pseudouridine55 synthase
LRRTRVGPFGEADAVVVGDLESGKPAAALRPVEAALTGLPSVAVPRELAGCAR